MNCQGAGDTETRTLVQEQLIVLFCLVSFVFCFFKMGFLCIVLAALELTLQTRLPSNSEASSTPCHDGLGLFVALCTLSKPPIKCFVL